MVTEFTHEDVVSYEHATLLHKLGFDFDTHYFYVTENYCEGNNPYMFDTYSVGELVTSPRYTQNESGEIVYDDNFNVPAPTLSQVWKWLGLKHDFIIDCFYVVSQQKWDGCVYRHDRELSQISHPRGNSKQEVFSNYLTTVLSIIENGLL